MRFREVVGVTFLREENYEDRSIEDIEERMKLSRLLLCGEKCTRKFDGSMSA